MYAKYFLSCSVASLHLSNGNTICVLTLSLADIVKTKGNKILDTLFAQHLVCLMFGTNICLIWHLLYSSLTLPIPAGISILLICLQLRAVFHKGREGVPGWWRSSCGDV